MKLYIDTSAREVAVIKLDEATYEKQTEPRKSVQLITFIEEKLKENGKTLTDIKEIEVVTGPGSFTGLRVGASVAQTLGWSLKVPVNGKEFNQMKFVSLTY